MDTEKMQTAQTSRPPIDDIIGNLSATEREQLKAILKERIRANKPSVFQRIGSDIKERYEKASSIISGESGTAPTRAEKFLQVGGQLANTAGDILGEALAAITPDSVERYGAKKVQDFMQNTLVGQYGIDTIEKYQEWAAKNPRAAANIESIASIASTVPAGKGASVAGKAAGKAAAEGAEISAKAGSKIARSAAAKARSMLPGIESADEKVLSLVSPVRSKKELRQAVKSGKGNVSRDIFGNPNLVTDRDRELAAVSRKYVNLKSKPEQNVVNIQKGISEIAEKDLRPFLQQNPRPYDYADLRKFLENRLRPSETIKSDNVARKTYERIRESTIEAVSKYPKNNEGLWEARKALDRILKKDFGDSIFGTLQHTAVKRGALDARNAINDFIYQNLAIDDIAGMNRIDDILKASRERGIAIESMDDAKRILRNQLGIDAPIPEDQVKAAFFRQKLKDMNLLYEARDNITDKLVSQFGNDKITRILSNPKYRSARNIFIGLGLAGSAAAGAKAVLADN